MSATQYIGPTRARAIIAKSRVITEEEMKQSYPGYEFDAYREAMVSFYALSKADRRRLQEPVSEELASIADDALREITDQEKATLERFFGKKSFNEIVWKIVDSLSGLSQPVPQPVSA